ncbi:DUF305 domain-containing protein [Pseudohongiella sp. O18]|uniref:DUF305 domain-containing protein n=1 Tax=Pseudohongiella sp. O18 TaxID=2904248 RepID=UPI001F3B51D6|nr:DUF305 domain-containing protein [Pseudohongiella sp. O18]
MSLSNSLSAECSIRFRRCARATLLVAIASFSASAFAQQVPIIQPGAPGQDSRELTAAEATNLATMEYVEADVRFMQGMIAHHQQAIEMSALVPDRAQRDSIMQLAERIALSQDDEIALMQDWLEERGEPTELPDGGHGMHHGRNHTGLMPGMITEEEMDRLEAAEGAEFDSLFLEFMIKHHEGAVAMVEDLLDQRGSAQSSVLFEFANEVTSDQTAEIERMELMLAGFSPDPRVNLAAGFQDAGQASMNMNLVAALSKPEGFYDPENPAGLPMSRVRALASGGQQVAAEDDDEEAEPRPSLLDFANTDLAFSGNQVVAGNYHGFNIYNIDNPVSPELLASVVCPGGQGDVTLFENLLIMSVEQTRGRLDCGLQGIADTISDERFRGLRIFDVSDITRPRQVAAVQTCRGSHTHTVIPDPEDDSRILVYNSGTSVVRDGEELEGCANDNPFENPETSRFRIDVIEVPLASPQDARVVNSPFIFSDPNSGVLAGLWEGGDHGPGTQRTAETNHCHDITAYPELGLAAGACSGNGILLDISDPENPQRLDQVVDTGFAYWHSATFNNDGTKVIFTDEWGGGSRARCRAQDPDTWGADAIYDIVDGKLQFRSYYKLPAPQSEQENCVAHNGSLVPVPGRDILAQSWYQGGISVVDFTDSSNPVEIAFFDRGPIDEEELVMGGYWSAYWHNGYIYGTEIARGLDVFELAPSDYLSENELAAASLLSSGGIVNVQTQSRLEWPAEPVVARAYLDQLQRSNVIDAGLAAALNDALAQADSALQSGNNSADAAQQLTNLAARFASAANDSSGATQRRYDGLADTLEGIAARLQ